MENTYTVGDLIKELSQFDMGAKVMFASDEEGNTFHTKGEVQLTDVSEDEKEDIRVVIYPLNSEEDIC